MKYIYTNANWRHFTFNTQKVQELLITIKKNQWYLLGKMESLGFEIKDNTQLKVLTEEIIKSCEIEGEILDFHQVRSSIARKLGIDIEFETVSSRNIDGIVEVMLDATQNYKKALTEERLFSWQASLFPTGYSGINKIETGKYRTDKHGPMQVVSGSVGKEKVHYEAPSATIIKEEMNYLIDYINETPRDDILIKAGIVHVWFLTLHPFEDGNGRIARALTDMLLSQSDDTHYRFYSMSTQIQKKRKKYYEILEKTQKGTTDITDWLVWFLETLLEAIAESDIAMQEVIKKAMFWQKNISIQFNKRQKKILIRFMDNFEGKLTTTKWAKMCNCSQDTANNDINDLIEKGILERKGEARATHYVLA